MNEENSAATAIACIAAHEAAWNFVESIELSLNVQCFKAVILRGLRIPTGGDAQAVRNSLKSERMNRFQ